MDVDDFEESNGSSHFVVVDSQTETQEWDQNQILCNLPALRQVYTGIYRCTYKTGMYRYIHVYLHCRYVQVYLQDLYMQVHICILTLQVCTGAYR